MGQCAIENICKLFLENYVTLVVNICKSVMLTKDEGSETDVSV